MINSTAYSSMAFWQDLLGWAASSSVLQICIWISFLFVLGQFQRMFLPYLLLRPVSYVIIFI